MSIIKRLIPNKAKLEIRYFLMRMLKIPFSRSNVPLEITSLLSKDRPVTFIDIGANAGHFSLAMCAEYKIEKGILIEPVDKLIPVLKNTFPNENVFKIIHAAVSDRIEETDFYVNQDADFVSSLFKLDNKGEGVAHLHFEDSVLTKVQALTLDHITKAEQLSIIDLIKIDVQGAEHLVLQGAVGTLKKTRAIYTEFSFRPVYEGSSVFTDLYKFLCDNNFILTHISPGFSAPNGELLQGDALFINKSKL